MSRSLPRRWIASASESVPRTRAWKNRSISSAAHRSRLVAGEPGDLRVRVPALERGEIPGDVTAEDDPLARDRLGEPAAVEHRSRRYTIAAMRRWSEVAERVAATTRTSEKTRLLADYLRTLPARRAPDRRRLPGRPAIRRGRPARHRPGLGDDRQGGHRPGRRDGGRPGRGLRPLVRPRRRGRRSPRPLERQPSARAGRWADADRGGRRLRRDRTARPVRPPRVRCSARPPRPVRPADREVRRQGPRRRAPDRPAGRAARGRHRGRVRPSARRGEVGRDAHRRHRRDRRPGPRRRPGNGRAASLPPAEVHARLTRGGRHGDPRTARPDGLGRGQVRRHPGPAPPARATRSGCTAATSTT